MSPETRAPYSASDPSPSSFKLRCIALTNGVSDHFCTRALSFHQKAPGGSRGGHHVCPSYEPRGKKSPSQVASFLDGLPARCQPFGFQRSSTLAHVAVAQGLTHPLCETHRVSWQGTFCRLPLREDERRLFVLNTSLFLLQVRLQAHRVGKMCVL